MTDSALIELVRIRPEVAVKMRDALRKIEETERLCDDVRTSGMVDYAEIKAVRAMAGIARSALSLCEQEGGGE